jgi:hypothetical protein
MITSKNTTAALAKKTNAKLIKIVTIKGIQKQLEHVSVTK